MASRNMLVGTFFSAGEEVYVVALKKLLAQGYGLAGLALKLKIAWR